MFDEYRQQRKKEMDAATFINIVCSGLRILEIWVGLMEKRYGSVVSGSSALKRLQAQLSTFAGLETVQTTAASGVVLHGASETQIGISECHYLVK